MGDQRADRSGVTARRRSRKMTIHWIVQVQGATVVRCERSDDSPSVPSSLRSSQPLADLAGNLRWSGTRRPRTSSPPWTPGCGSRAASTRSSCSGPWAAPGWRSWQPTRDSWPDSARHRRPNDLPHRRSLVPAAWAGRRPGRDRLLLTGVRHHRRAPSVLRRPRHPGGRPPQGGLRPRGPHRRRRACSTSTATSSRPCPGRDGSRRATRCSTPTSCRSRSCASRTDRGRASRSPCRTDPSSSPASGSPASDGCRS